MAPLRAPEPPAATILMRVINPKAPRFGETGRIVDTEGEGDLIIIILEFADGDRKRYARVEVELVMP